MERETPDQIFAEEELPLEDDERPITPPADTFSEEEEVGEPLVELQPITEAAQLIAQEEVFLPNLEESVEEDRAAEIVSAAEPEEGTPVTADIPEEILPGETGSDSNSISEASPTTAVEEPLVPSEETVLEKPTQVDSLDVVEEETANNKSPIQAEIQAKMVESDEDEQSGERRSFDSITEHPVEVVPEEVVYEAEENSVVSTEDDLTAEVELPEDKGSEVENLEEMDVETDAEGDLSQMQTLKMIDLSIDGNVVRAEVIQEDELMDTASSQESTTMTADEDVTQGTEIATVVECVESVSEVDGAEEGRSVANDPVEAESMQETDIITELPRDPKEVKPKAVPKRSSTQIFAEIIEEEIIEEQTYEITRSVSSDVTRYAQPPPSHYTMAGSNPVHQHCSPLYPYPPPHHQFNIQPSQQYTTQPQINHQLQYTHSHQFVPHQGYNRAGYTNSQLPYFPSQPMQQVSFLPSQTLPHSFSGQPPPNQYIISQPAPFYPPAVGPQLPQAGLVHSQPSSQLSATGPSQADLANFRLFKSNEEQSTITGQQATPNKPAGSMVDDFITSLDPSPAPPTRRLQAREDAAKRKDESMLRSTKKIMDDTDDVLRSAHELLKSTESGQGSEDQRPLPGNKYPVSDNYMAPAREKRQKKKKSKPEPVKEKEVDPDYDPDDDFDDKEFLSPKDLESAAFASRLPADRMTKQEAISFSDIFNSDKESHEHFLYIRNRLLFVWLEDPKTKLTVENSSPRIEPPHDEDEKLVTRVYEYLNRYGFINFGVFDSPNLLTPAPDAPKVLVIGAGVSGLTAARQLQEFGLHVEVLEARSVVGGRVSTFKEGAHVADLGAMVVTGLGGNPLAVLAKQLNLDLMPIKQDCPLYEFTGQMVPKERDERVEREFNRLLEATTYMSHQLNVNSINGRPVSLGQALEIIIKLQIRQVKEKQLKHGRERCEIQEKLNHIQQALFPLHEKIKDSHSKYLELKMKHEELSDQLGEVIRDQKAEFEVKASYKVMLETFAEYDALLKEQQELEVKLTKMEQMVPNEIYMTPQERHVLDWHCANLEFANAAPLSALSLKHWDQDDDFEFTGNHLVVHDGMSAIPDALSKGLKIRHNTACVGIKYTDIGVEVSCREVNQTNSSWATNSTSTISADAVLLTIPLGVLKKEKLKFEPPLPEWKTSAIKRMGFGNLNKVVLCFNKVFWDPSIHLFGHVSNSTISRGELFLFWSISKAPVLIALIAGEAATVIETVPDEAIVGRAMTILRAIYGFQTVPQPSKHKVTRWRGDPWALGSYSYVAAGSSGNDYDDLARPVAPQNATGAQPRVFFAGEHTIRNYPATVHGALLSGLREAGRITDQFLGPPSAKEQLPAS